MKNLWLGTIALTALVAGPAVAAPPGGLHVNVVNPPDSPVPVEVQGLPEVDVSNTPETPLHVRDVDRRARTPVNGRCTSLFIGPGEPVGGCSFEPEVEAGKRLVVEFISASIRYPHGQTGGALADISHEGNEIHILLQTLQRVDILGDDHYVISQPIRFYVPAGKNLTVFINRLPYLTNIVTAEFYMSGYLIDVDEE